MESQPAKRVSGHKKQAILREIEQAFLADISAGTYRLGEALPSLRELIAKYKVPYRVGRDFYKYLQDRGKVIAIPRKGIFLADDNPTDALRPGTFLKRNGILVVTRIEITHPHSIDNDNVKQLYAIERECAASGIPIRFYNLYRQGQVPGNITDSEIKSYREDIKNYSSAGIIYLVDPAYDRQNASDILKQENTPVIVVGRLTGQYPEVTANEEASSYKATTHLIEQGHTKIGFLAYDTEHVWMSERISGYRKALDMHGLRKSDYIAKISYDSKKHDPWWEFEQSIKDEVYAALQEARSRCTAVLCGSDAIGKLILDNDNEYNVAKEDLLDFITFDDKIHYRGYDMSSVSHTPELEAKSAFQLLIRHVMDPYANTENCSVAGTLWVRSSSQRRG